MSGDPNMNNASDPPEQAAGDPQYVPKQPSNYGQKEMLFQPPTALPRPNFPEVKNSGYTSVPLHDKELGTGEWKDSESLESKTVRRGFIRKVYSILMLQLLITFGIIALFIFTPSIRDFVRNPKFRWLFWTSYAIFLVIYFVLVCSRRAARRFPCNMISLGILTLSMSYVMGTVSAFYKIESVFIAVGITAFVCLGVTLFSCQTKYDFTLYLGILVCVSWALLGFGIVCIFTYSRIMYTIYAGLGAVLFSVFLAVDTQLIIGGKKHEISSEDYVFGTLMLYMDIVNIFLHILSCSGWSYWQFKKYQDLTTTTRPARVESFYTEDGQLEINKVRALSRSYAQAIAGQPTYMNFDPLSCHFQLTFNINTDIQQPTIVYINEELNYPNGFNITVSPVDSLTWNSPSRNYYEFLPVASTIFITPKTQY